MMAATKHTPTKTFSGHHPSPSYRSDLFVVRVAIYINGLPTEVKGNDNFTSLVSPSSHYNYHAVPLSAVIEKVSTILTSSEGLDIVVGESYYDQSAPILSVYFPPNKILENIQALLSKAQALAHSVRVETEPLFTGQDHIESTPTAEISTKLKLYRCSTKEECRISEVTEMDAKYHVDMYESSVVFKFTTLMDRRSSLQRDKGVDVKFDELVKELNKAVDEWFNIGVQLQVPLHILLTIRKKPESDMDHLTDMLIWLVENIQVSWAKVVCALCTVNKRSLARSISKTYGCVIQCEENHLEKDEVLEDKMRLRLAAARASSEEVRHDINQLTNSDIPELKKKIEVLTKDKDQLKKKLEHERKAFDIMVGYRQQSIQQEEEREETDSEMAALKDSINELQKKLECSELEYKNTTARMNALIDYLSQKSCELEVKSSALTELEESLLKMDGETQAAERQSEDQKHRDFARSCSQTEYMHQIQTQIESEEKTIFDNEQEVQRIDDFLQAKGTELSAASERLKNVKSSVLERGRLLDGENPNLETIEMQIEVTKFNIEVVDMRSEYTLENVRKNSLQVETEHRLLSLKSKKNLLPCLARCATCGLTVPVHKTQVSCPVDFTVTLYDEGGQMCTGDHIVRAKISSTFCFPQEEDIIAAQENGKFVFTYIPHAPGEYTLEIFINDIQFSETKLFITNSPHLANCTVSGEGLTTASKNKVSSFQVFLADKNGSPVNSEQAITAHLLLPPHDSDCLVLPAHVTKWEVPDVYSVSYMPSVSGQCELTILVNGEPLAESVKVAVKNTNLPPLAGAALHGELDFVKLLLGHNENLTNIDKALNEASRNGHIETIKHLLKIGANVNSLNKHKRTPLFLAAWHGHAGAVELLATEGADVNAVDKRSRSALMLAAWHGHELTVRALIKHGATVNSKDELGDSPLHDAARNGHVTIIKTLLASGAIVDTTNMLGDSPLHDAARNGHVPVFATLLASGAIVDARNISDQTPLMTAASNGHSSAVQVLIENKADPNTRDTHLRSPLLFAVENHHSSTVVTLIECGADVDAKNYRDNTALHIASCEPRLKKSEKQKLQTLNVLIEKGADMNIRNKDLQSPLLIAACYGCVETVHTLVKGGADINIKDWLSRTATDCARELEHKEVYEYLQSVHQTTV